MTLAGLPVRPHAPHPGVPAFHHHGWRREMRGRVVASQEEPCEEDEEEGEADALSDGAAEAPASWDDFGAALEDDEESEPERGDFCTEDDGEADI